MPGDGVGPEVMAEALLVLDVIARRFDVEFEISEEQVGGASIDAYGVPLREEGLAAARDADAVLFGAVGDPRYSDPNAKVRPEQAILALRRGLGLFANLRPVKPVADLLDATPLRPEVVEGTDMLIVRELTGGIYFGEHRRWKTESGRHASDVMHYTEPEVRRIVELAASIAKGRRGKVASIDKANVLDASRLWREVATEVAADHPDVAFEHVLVDAFAMHILRRPRDFDVVVTSNVFGDILSDEASMLVGSMGMMPSASVGTPRADGTAPGLYEPIHGSAPDIAGEGIANPIGMILSMAMMLRHSLGLTKQAEIVETAVRRALGAGARTADLTTQAAISTKEMGRRVAAQCAEIEP
jgi:3-isopropylmalate dehydrogenase